MLQLLMTCGAAAAWRIPSIVFDWRLQNNFDLYGCFARGSRKAPTLWVSTNGKTLIHPNRSLPVTLHFRRVWDEIHAHHKKIICAAVSLPVKIRQGRVSTDGPFSSAFRRHTAQQPGRDQLMGRFKDVILPMQRPLEKTT